MFEGWNYQTIFILQIVSGRLFVSKKDGRLRLIVDCRPTNRMFRDPPGISLATGEAFSKIEVEYDFSDFEPSNSFGVASGMADVPDCFHRMLLPAEMCE